MEYVREKRAEYIIKHRKKIMENAFVFILYNYTLHSSVQLL